MRFIVLPLLLWLVHSASAQDTSDKELPYNEELEEMVGEPPSIKGRYIVLFDEKKLDSSRVDAEQVAADLAEEVGATLVHTFTRLISGFSIKDATGSSIKKLKENELVKEIMQDAVVHKHDIQYDDLPWNLDRIDDDKLLDGSFEYPGNAGEGTHIYILDTGIRVDHEEFEGRIAPDSENANFIETSQTPPWNDCDGHGTHVASTAAGTKYGVAKKATVHAFRVLNCYGYGYASSVASALGVVDEQCDDDRLCVVNLSLGFWYSSDIAILNRAANALVETGVTLVTSAGNDDNGLCYKSPASAEKAITVGSTYIYRYNPGNDTRSYFSNFGPCVDIFAPGSYVLGASYWCSTCTTTKSGTSMASPLVAGVAAVILQDFKDFGMPTSAEAVKERLQAEALVGIIGMGDDVGDDTLNLMLQMTKLTVSLPPSPAPSETSAPSDIASNSPSLSPTVSVAPSARPSSWPSMGPTEMPSLAPSPSPSSAPSDAVCDPGLQKIEIFVQTDHNGEETSFTLENNCAGGGVLLQRSEYSLADLTPYSWVLCVGFGRFVFTISDDDEDGITYPGYYQVKFEDELVVRGSYFGASEQTIFGDEDCITPAPTHSNPPSVSPTVSLVPTSTLYPTPAPTNFPSEAPSSAPTEFSCGDTSSYLFIELHTDSYGYQVSFEVLDFCGGGQVLEVPVDTLGYREYYTWQLCINRGMHKFIIRDTNNNGLYYPGWFRVTLNDETVVYDPYYSSRYEVTFGKDCVCPEGEKFFALEIETDEYPEEIGFELDDCDGNEVIGVDPGDLTEEKYYHYPVCISPESHTLTIRDSYGDGIYYPGFVRAMYDDLVVLDDPDYDWSYEVSFGQSCGGDSTDDGPPIDDECPCDQSFLPFRLFCMFRYPMMCMMPAMF